MGHHGMYGEGPHPKQDNARRARRAEERGEKKKGNRNSNRTHRMKSNMGMKEK